MKPLKLKIAGLQSFREEQEIPFDRLSERGVFGIFGPTGSGKSTILDAVTLALYGKVVRASHKTQGILNTSEKRLTVSFLFELNMPGGKKKFRVDRRYSRKDEISVKHDHSRLIEIDQEDLETVLVEGEGRVTSRVEALLGMKVEDFTRAVVLPQGKFAEFLTLDGGSRRKMLQRLFSLERYGKVLTERLNERVNRVGLELARVESELAGIGDASKKSLDETAKRVEEAKVSEESALTKLKEAESQYEKARRSRELQEELDQVEKGMVEHASRGDEIRIIESAVTAAERAAKVIPLIKALEEASIKKEKGCSAKEEAETTAARCRKVALVKKGLCEAAKAHREKEVPKLIALKAGLEAAQKLEEEVSVIESELHIKKKERQLKLRERNDNKEKAKKLDGKRTALHREIKREEENLTLNTVTGSRREKVAQVKQQADLLTAMNSAIRETKVEFLNRRVALTAAEEERKKTEKALAYLEEQINLIRFQEEKAVQPASDEELAQNEIRIIRKRENISKLAGLDDTARSKKDLATGLKKELQALENAVLEANVGVQKTNDLLLSLNRRLTEAYLQNRRILAAKLAGELIPGAACPVCGSTDHPRPAPINVEFDTEEGAIEELRKEIEAAEKAVGEAVGKANAAAAAVSGKKAELDVAEKELERVQEESLALGRFLLGESFEIRQDIKKIIKDLLKEVDEKELKLKGERGKLKAWREERQAVQKRLHDLSEDLTRKKSDNAVAVQKISAAKKELVGAKEALEKAEANSGNAAKALKEALKELGIEDEDVVKAAGEAAAEIKKMDDAAETAGARLEQLRKELVLCDKDFEEARRAESAANVIISGMDSLIAEKEKFLNARQSELNKMTGGRPAAVLLAETIKKLEDIQDAENVAKEAYDKAETERVKAEEDLVEKTFSWQEAVKRLEKCRKDLAEMIRKQNFVTAKEAEDAYLSEDEITEKKLIIDAWKDEGKRLSGNWERITALINDKRISSEEWLEVQNNLKRARVKKEEATKQFVEVAKEFRDLSEKHMRWKGLEKQRKVLAQEGSRLDSLKKLLRGDRFVQFLAHEQLEFVVRHATERLKRMTNGRYALLVDSESNFLVRDDANGSVKRPVTSLSGGETFQASLAMALALSTQIQLRGQHPLEFFFLDEGFGSLDQNFLEVMVSTLEGLHLERMTIGVISHVGELQQRIGRRLLVEPAESNGRGSRVKLDFA